MKPDAVMGHSVGEYVAACVAGVFSLEDGLKLIAHRGQLMQALSQDGAMAVVFAKHDAVAEALSGREDAVSLAAVNGPTSCVVSGRREIIKKMMAEFEAQGVRTRALTVSHAFHSAGMAPMCDALAEFAATLTWHHTKIPIISYINGTLYNDPPVPAYWGRQIREAMRFADNMAAVNETGIGVWI